MLHALSIALRLRLEIDCGDRPPGASNAGDAAGPFTRQGAPRVPAFYGLLGCFRRSLVVVIPENNTTTYPSWVQAPYGPAQDWLSRYG